MRSLISRNVVYPPNARIEGASGKVVVHLTLKRDGSVESLEIVESAGSRDLDSAVLNAIRRVRHFPPFPEEMADKDSVAFAIPVDFHLDTPTPHPYNPPTVRPKVKPSPAADEFSEFLKSLSKKER
ncbi:energy transducer TonB [Paenalcaligenes suwonensis]|nr:energy transducer TonB [Paenalcaligenes suwonensis]